MNTNLNRAHHMKTLTHTHTQVVCVCLCAKEQKKKVNANNPKIKCTEKTVTQNMHITLRMFLLSPSNECFFPNILVVGFFSFPFDSVTCKNIKTLYCVTGLFLIYSNVVRIQWSWVQRITKWTHTANGWRKYGKQHTHNTHQAQNNIMQHIETSVGVMAAVTEAPLNILWVELKPQWWIT